MKRKDARILQRMLFGIWLGLVVSPLYGWELFTHAGINLPYERQVEDPWFLDIGSQEAWAAFWLEMIPTELDPVSELWDVPEIDFDNYRVLAGGLGRVNSGGHNINVSVYMSGPDRLVYATATIAGAGCVVAQVVNYPTTAILIPRTNREPHISFRSEVHDCQ